MEHSKKLYYIYHIPGKKIGVTQNISNRVTNQQGYNLGEFEILEISSDIDYVSKMELELQELYGYKIDNRSYKELVNKQLLSTLNKLDQMKLNVTDQTTTFPFPLNKLKGVLMDSLGASIELNSKSYELTPALIDWIAKNALVSQYNNTRSFIYNKALESFQEPSDVEPVQVNIYDLIRNWATERGIYANGDVKTQYIKLQEEAGELAKAILKNDDAEFIDAIGDMIVVLTNLAALKGLNVEDCIESAYNVIKSRKGSMINGSFVKESSLEEKTSNHFTKTL
jgi:phosphoribosyl-ATP pyrophosphohydrolase